MDIKTEKGEEPNPRRIYWENEAEKTGCELIRTKITVDSRPVYQKGLHNTLLEACKLAFETFKKFDKTFYLVHNDRNNPLLIDGSMTSIEMEQHLLKQ